jgi:hypothetical protein
MSRSGQLVPALLCWILACWSPVTARDSAIPELVVDSRSEFQAHAARIRDLDPRRLEHAMRVVGLHDPGPAIRLTLAGEDSAVAQNTPPWIAGFAYPSLGIAVLFPERSPSYPDSNFEDLVLHEVSHILTARAAGARPVPRWLDEGLALFIGRPWQLEDRSRLTWAMLREREMPMVDLEGRFNSDRASATRAYAIAGAFVHDLVRKRGVDSMGAILAGIALGLPFPEAFERAIGVSLSQAESFFWDYHSVWHRWVPLVSSSMALWLAITLLALLAFRRRRSLDAALLQEWEEQERRLDDEVDSMPPERLPPGPIN